MSNFYFDQYILNKQTLNSNIEIAVPDIINRIYKNINDTSILDLKGLKKQIQNKEFFNIIIIGSGSSIIIPRSIKGFLKNHFLENKPKIFFIEDIYPDNIYQLLQQVKGYKTLFITISYSGETLETLTILKYLSSSLDHTKHKFITITNSKQNSLIEFSKTINSDIYCNPTEIPGKYNVFSHALYLMLTIYDINLEEFSAGAKEIIESVINEGKYYNYIKEYIQSYYQTNKHNINIMINHIPSLQGILSWYEHAYLETFANSYISLEASYKVNHSKLAMYLSYNHSPISYSIITNNSAHNKKHESSLLASVAKVFETQQKLLINSILEHSKFPTRIINIQNINARSLGAIFAYFLIEVIITASNFSIPMYTENTIISNCKKQLTLKVNDENRD